MLVHGRQQLQLLLLFVLTNNLIIVDVLIIPQCLLHGDQPGPRIAHARKFGQLFRRSTLVLVLDDAFQNDEFARLTVSTLA